MKVFVARFQISAFSWWPPECSYFQETRLNLQKVRAHDVTSMKLFVSDQGKSPGQKENDSHHISQGISEAVAGSIGTYQTTCTKAWVPPSPSIPPSTCGTCPTPSPRLIPRSNPSPSQSPPDPSPYSSAPMEPASLRSYVCSLAQNLHHQAPSQSEASTPSPKGYRAWYTYRPNGY